MRNSPSWLTTVPIAHRGLHDGNRQVAENTEDAFMDAVARGYAVELDVYATETGELVVHHDPTLLRLAGLPVKVSELTASDLAEIRLATGQPIPTLDVVLRSFRGQVPVVVELKSQPRHLRRILVRRVADLVRAYPPAMLAVSSFDPRIVAWFASRHPRTVRGLNAGAATNRTLQPASDLAIGHQVIAPQFVGYDVTRLPTRTTRQLRRRGVPIVAYTVRTSQQWDLARHHSDGMFFELPTLGGAPSPERWQTDTG